MIEAFDFWEAGRTYTCYVERLNGPGSEAWWWFDATGDGHRYAPFRANERDTRKSVRERVIAYHVNLLTRRAAPPTPHNQWGRRGKPGTNTTPGTPATPGTPGTPAKPGTPASPPAPTNAKK
jgi:hypothetical protein